MLVLVDAPSFLKSLYEETKEISDKIFDEIMEAGDRVELPAGADLLQWDSASYFYLHSGRYQFVDTDGHQVRGYSARDFVAGGRTESLSGSRIVCTEAGDATVFERELFMQVLAKKPALLSSWMRLQELETRVLHVVSSLFIAKESAQHIQMATFEPGDTIIREGSTADEVFLMVEGKAKVVADGVTVGSVDTGEIFGEIAFLTRQKRTATVTADTRCLVEVANGEDIPKLVRARPAIFIEMARGLARRVVALNAQLRAIKED